MITELGCGHTNDYQPTPAEQARTTMGGKPVITIPAKTVINFKSGFMEKKLCDGLTFSTGTACNYTCSFCYVPAIMGRSTASKLPEGKKHEDVVLRRENALEILKGQLMKGNFRRFTDPDDRRVIYASPLVDVAGNMELVRETIEACKLILDLTHWRIRLLSKSNLLPKIARALEAPEELQLHARARIIYGVSTGTFDDNVAAAIEQGTPHVSKRIESLHWLQDNGFRTFGMVCPSLPNPPGEEYQFARLARLNLRYERCEHVWAEIINIRGESFTRTIKALREAQLHPKADLLEKVATNKDAWEQYSRRTFMAHASECHPDKLRFLQYVNAGNLDWWKKFDGKGAVLLGAAAH